MFMADDPQATPPSSATESAREKSSEATKLTPKEEIAGQVLTGKIGPAEGVRQYLHQTPMKRGIYNWLIVGLVALCVFLFRRTSSKVDEVDKAANRKINEAQRERDDAIRDRDKYEIITKTLYPGVPSGEALVLATKAISNGTLRLETKLDDLTRPPELSLFIAINGDLNLRVDLTNDFINFKRLPDTNLSSFPPLDETGVLLVPVRTYQVPVAMAIGASCSDGSNPANGLECTLIITNRVRFQAPEWGNWSKATYVGMTGLSKNYEKVLTPGSDKEFPFIFWYPQPSTLEISALWITLKSGRTSISVLFQIHFFPVLPMVPDARGRLQPFDSRGARPIVMRRKDFKDMEKMHKILKSNGWLP
jgi:hypothetical protein